MIIDIGKLNGVATSQRSTRRMQSPLFRMPEFSQAPDVSFCISHRNRLHQIKETLPRNLADNFMDRHRVEFVLVDFGSEENVSEWILSEFQEYLESGYLKYFECHELEGWHAPLAKNTTHRMATGKILVNLDGDNFTGYRGGEFVFNKFKSLPYDVCLWQFSGNWHDGSFGRIAASRDAFISLGGYNEEFLEMGFQDRDLVNRLEMSGASVILAPDEEFNQAIVNEKYEPEGMDYKVMRKYNRYISGRLLRTDMLTANSGKLGLSPVRQLLVDQNGVRLDYVDR